MCSVRVCEKVCKRYDRRRVREDVARCQEGKGEDETRQTDDIQGYGYIIVTVIITARKNERIQSVCMCC